MSKGKKGIAALIAVVAIICIGVFWKTTVEGEKGEKQIYITIDTGNEHIQTNVSTDCETLKELLTERSELQAVMEDSTYGTLLTSLAGYDQDMQKGPWWVFSSPNNQVCLAQPQQMCPAIDQVVIYDQDEFVFSLITEF